MSRAIINFCLLLLLLSLPWLSVGFIVSRQNQITPNDEFFTNSVVQPPKVNVSSWILSVYGHVRSPIAFDYENFTSLPSQSEIVTLRCVEGYSGTANWRGILLSDILSLVQVEEGAIDVIFIGADGYSSSLTMSEASQRDVLLAYEMNGEPLPVGQGFPLRVVAPGHFGYKWVMWVYEIRVVDYEYRGFWENRGWNDDASYYSLKDWLLHATLFSITFLFGGFSFISGLKNTGRIDKLELPEFIANRNLHLIMTVTYLIVSIVTFIYWIIQTIFLKGSVFYSLHGLIALLSIVGLVSTGLTGLFNLKRITRLKSWHLILSTFSFTIYSVTVVIGILIGLGFRSFFL
ncbi:MAG: molybdopterin-dependent oxidoreductase [Candidatus Hodarchaeales archaeon]